MQPEYLQQYLPQDFISVRFRATAACVVVIITRLATTCRRRCSYAAVGICLHSGGMLQHACAPGSARWLTCAVSGLQNRQVVRCHK